MCPCVDDPVNVDSRECFGDGLRKREFSGTSSTEDKEGNDAMKL